MLFKETREYTFSSLTETYKKFYIPHFQRAYDWKKKDISGFIGSVIENKENYYIGNIVGVSENGGLSIVDGQQRITSISLALVAIRNEYRKNRDSRPEDTKVHIERVESYLKDVDRSVPPAKPYKRLKPSRSSLAEIYDKIVEASEIEERSLDRQQKVYLSNYRTIESLINQQIQDRGPEALIEIETKLVTLTVIAIVCETPSMVYGLFEGLNSKGLPLSQADLVKNAVLESVHKNNIDEVEGRWDEMEDWFISVPSDTNLLPRFLRHQWISRNGYINNADLFDNIKRTYLIPGDVNRYVDELYQDASLYLGMQFEMRESGLAEISQLGRPGHKPIVSKEIVPLIKRFRLLENVQIYEVLLGYVRKYKEDPTFKPSYLKDAVGKLWVFVLRTTFISINPSKYERLFADVCGILAREKGENIPDKTQPVFRNLWKLVKAKDEFLESFSSDLSYKTDKKLVEEILADLIRLRQGEEGAIMDPGSRSVEHILPQEPARWNLTKREIKDYVHNIGNLTLLAPDTTGNKTIEEKRDIYAKSTFRFNSEDLVQEWCPRFRRDWKKAILDRSRDLAEKAEDYYRFK